jgi:hypothetical protein
MLFMRQLQPFSRPVRYFSIWQSLQARVLGIPVFGSGKPQPPREVSQEGRMAAHLNGEIPRVVLETLVPQSPIAYTGTEQRTDIHSLQTTPPIFLQSSCDRLLPRRILQDRCC